MGQERGKFRIGLISDSDIANDPRVRRQGDALSAAGFEVIGVGVEGASAKPPAWPVRSIVPSQPVASRARQFRRLLDMPRQLVDPAHAFDVYWRLNPRHRALAEEAAQHDVDLWIANDWTTLPIVLDIANRGGAPFAYDTHELAIDEFAQNLKWRLSLRPVIGRIESEGIRKARFVTCVSDGIATRLQTFHRLEVRPHVVRNTPRLEAGVLRPTGEQIRVLYHGVIVPGRALEECIASVALWRPEFSLTIRGPGEPAYIEDLQRLAASTGVAHRLTFLPPVPMTELVAEACAFDVGLFAIKGHSRQNEFVLPNKFFEYAMAGLALCVSDLPEMRLLLETHGMGHLIEAATPQAIAAAINALDPQRIDAFKANALAAARELCWERESETLITLVKGALTEISARATNPSRRH
jgi:glycosyltransferase involved in cell wall biosynthesis